MQGIRGQFPLLRLFFCQGTLSVGLGVHSVLLAGRSYTLPPNT
jgi:hypothetical protein